MQATLALERRKSVSENIFMRGRPQLIAQNRHPLNVLISEADYTALRQEAAAVSSVVPGYSVGDLVRRYITQGLGKRSKHGSVDPEAVRLRMLHSAARGILQVARELKKK